VSWELLSAGSSQTPVHTCDHPGERGCRRCRWFEVRLHRRCVPDGDCEYKLEMIGRSTVRGEVDRIRTETTTSANAVVDFLALGEPHARYLPKVSRKVLHEAADEDEDLGNAIDDFDSVTAP